VRLAFCLYKYFPHGGLSRDMRRIAEEAAGRGHSVDIYTGAWQGERPEDATINVLDAGGFSNHGRAERFIRRLGPRLSEAGHDAVVGFNKMPGLDFYYAADGCFAARARRQRPRLYELSPRYRSYHRMEAAVFGPRSTARIMLLSEQSRLEYLAYYYTAEERLRLLPPTLDRVHRRGPLAPERRTELRTALGVGEQDALVLLVGSGLHTKGADRALRALAALGADRRRRARLAVVGKGRTGYYQSLARRLGVADQVVFTGGRDDVPELLRAADLLVHPARQENTGNVLLEALAAGLPVVTTANCGYAHHVREAGAGTILDTPFEQQALDRALAGLLEADRTRFAENARRYGGDDALYRMPAAAVDLIEEWWVAPPARSFAGYVHPELASLARARPRLTGWLDMDGEVYRLTRDRKTVRFEHAGCGYFLKAHFGVGWGEILKNLLQLKLPVLGAGNEWLATHLLRTLGLPTLTAVACGFGDGLWARRQSFIVTRELRGLTSLEDFVAQPHPRDRSEARRRRQLICKLAATARTLHGNGLNHRDFYLCHFLFDPAVQGGDTPLYLIDLHRAQVRRRTPRRWRIKDIGGLYYSALGASPTRNERMRFVRAYAAAGSLRAALADRSFWAGVERRARALRRAEIKRGYADVSGRPKPVN